MENAPPTYTCPIPNTHDKFEEAHFFLDMMMKEFHEPKPFRWNLNAFLQALRSIRNMLEMEIQNQPGYKDWYKPWKEFLNNDELIKRLGKGRDIVVHQRMLRSKSHVQAGAFRGSLLKLALNIEIDINKRSEDALNDIKKDFIDFVGGEEHPWVGEQLGVRRTWIVEELGNEDVVILCNQAWCKMSKVVAAAHSLVGRPHEELEEDDKTHDVNLVNLLLESDLDPTLPEKWEW